jgi:hypothetical protein
MPSAGAAMAVRCIGTAVGNLSGTPNTLEMFGTAVTLLTVL